MVKKILFFSITIAAVLFFAPKSLATYGDVSTYVGKLYAGDGGLAVKAYLDFPEDLAFDSSGNMYIADTYNNVIRRITPAGIISTFAGTGSYGQVDGSASRAEFAMPRGVTVGGGGAIYVSDSSNRTIRKISGGTVSTIVPANQLTNPTGLALYGIAGISGLVKGC
jgi:DNA-binding beta-propeller fold protein YncE